MMRDRILVAVFMFLAFVVPMIVILRVYATVFFRLNKSRPGKNKEKTRRQ